MPNKSVMQHQFSRVPQAEIQRSNFNRSHGHKTTFDAGYLYPFFVDEVLPGDTFNLRATLFARMNTPIFPIMDNVFLDTFYFFVPNRLLWPNWQRFNGEQDNPDDSTDYEMPVISYTLLGASTPISPGSFYDLADHFGLPVRSPLPALNPLEVNALPFRAYNLIYNEWFRDENLQDSVPTPWKTLVGVTQPMIDGPDPTGNYSLKKRGKRHDYFTSCLPWPQKGPGVELPLGGQAPLVLGADFAGIGQPSIKVSGIPGSSIMIDIASSSPTADRPLQVSDAAASGNAFYLGGTTAPVGLSGGERISLASNNSGIYGQIANSPLNYADLDSATSTGLTINSFRQAFQIQRLLERDARGGTRYTEILRSHFGVTSPDARLQRPEFLGGGSQRLNVSTVPQTSGTDSTSPQGNLAAFATFNTTNGFVHSFVEHGIIIGMFMVRADLTYQSGLNRMWSRKTRFDHYWPALAHLGEQAVLNKEIWASGNDADDEVFGYQERYAEYRYKPSTITGKFRSSDPTPLDAWHVSQDFTTLPQLNDSFISEDPPIDRVVAVPSEPQFILDSYINLQCARPMPVYSVPGLIDHF